MLLSLKPDVQPKNLGCTENDKIFLGLGDDPTEIRKGRCLLHFAVSRNKAYLFFTAASYGLSSHKNLCRTVMANL